MTWQADSSGHEPHPLSGIVSIVGVAAETSSTGRLDADLRSLEALVAQRALDEAGLRLSDVDGLAMAGSALSGLQTCEYLGIRPTWTDTTNVGGASFGEHVQHAMAAVATGQCDVVLVLYASTQRSDMLRKNQPRSGVDAYGPHFAEWEAPFRISMPVGAYALAASRHMAEYGTTHEELAAIAVSTRLWAGLNPDARYREPLSTQDVLDSPVVCGSLHRLDCCLVTDGAAAVVITRSDRARDLTEHPVAVLGAGAAHSHTQISQLADLTTTPGRQSGEIAFAMAGVGPTDIDVLELYDSFTITVLLALEDLGIAPRGEGGRFVADGRLGPGGSHPTNTSGGGLSFAHPGMFGLFLIVEAVRQLRGDAGDRQVPHPRLALAHGCGGILSAASTLVLGAAS